MKHTAKIFIENDKEIVSDFSLSNYDTLKSYIFLPNQKECESARDESFLSSFDEDSFAECFAPLYLNF